VSRLPEEVLQPPAVVRGKNDPLAQRPWPRAPLLMVASSSRTGPAEGQIATAHYLRAQGIDARFAADTTQPGDIGDHLAHAGVPWLTELRLSRKVKVRDVLHDALLMARWAREGRPDLMHAAFAHDHHLCLWAALRAGPARQDLRVVRTAHRREDVEPGRLRHRTRALRATDGVIVHCRAYRELLLRQGLQPERVLALPGAVDAARFSPGRAPHLRAQWGVPEGAPLAGIVARMKPERGHRALLAAFAQAQERVKDAWLVLIGRGDDEPALRKLAGPRVVFGGYLRGEGLVDAYRALDVAVWLREGNDGACRGVLEAMACGVPLIAGSEGAPGELVRDGVDGSAVDANDPASIAAALAALLGDMERARRLGAAARGRALEHTAERSGAALLGFYRSLRVLPPARIRP
jgi:glycosyltransferase involved in cell wall biosynthesis